MANPLPQRSWPRRGRFAALLSFVVVGTLALGPLLSPDPARAEADSKAALPLPAPFVLESGDRSLPDFIFQEWMPDGRLKEWGFVDLRGRPIVAVSWATWCGVCAKDLPKLAALSARLAKKTPLQDSEEKSGKPGDVLVAALSIDDVAPRKVAAALADRGIGNLRTFIDTDKMFFLTTSGVGVPSAIIADPTGRIVARAQGSVDWQDPALLAFIESLAK